MICKDSLIFSKQINPIQQTNLGFDQRYLQNNLHCSQITFIFMHTQQYIYFCILLNISHFLDANLEKTPICLHRCLLYFVIIIILIILLLFSEFQPDLIGLPSNNVK